MTISQTNVGCLVANVALGKDGPKFQDRVERFIQSNGVEWTCNRLKVIWNAALLLRNGDRSGARDLYQENSISYRKDTLVPRGPEGIAFQQFLTAERPSVIKRKAAALRYYTTMRLSDVSEKQRHKALTAIAGESRCKASDPTSVGMSDTVAALADRRFTPTLKPLTGDEIHCEHLRSTSKYYSRNKVPKDLRGVPYSSMAMSFMTEPWVPKALDKNVPCFEMRQHILNDPVLQENPQYFAGKVTFLQEQGCKARVVCQPSAWLQLAFMPLHNRLMRISEQLFPKESCVTDQSSGAYAMMKHLSEGKPVYCTDLSSATDRFPRDYSLGVLRTLGYKDYADALDEVCQQPFKCDQSPTGEIRYRVGQPMGLYGSFPLFHLSNMLVALSAVKEAELFSGLQRHTLTPFSDGSYFRTVGDDIIFSDGLVSQQYRKKMEWLGVTISESKSFSGKVGEFAGFIGIETEKSVVVFRPYKVPDKGLNNGIQFLDAMGSKVKKISPYWSRTFDTFQSTVSSRDVALEPLVPGDELGHCRSANRGDNQSMVNLCNAIASISKDSLPDLSGSTKINKIPLFRERGMFDFYGYNPDLLRKDEEQNVHPMRRTRGSISKDPLIKEARDLQKGLIERPTRIINRQEPQIKEEPQVEESLIVETPEVQASTVPVRIRPRTVPKEWEEMANQLDPDLYGLEK